MIIIDRTNIVLISILIIAIVIVFAVVGFAIVQHTERSNVAEQYGCTYLGTARDLIGVWFYNCNGEIILKPSGQHP